MTMCRQVQLRRGSSTALDLNTAPYSVTAPGWSNAGTNLEIGVLVQAASLAEWDRYVGVLQRWVALGELVERALLSDAVYVWTKTCDDVAGTAELGATWLVKRVLGGSVVVPDVSESAAGVYAARVVLSLEVEGLWRRAAPECGLEASGTVVVAADGSVSLSGTLTARRAYWTAAGLVARYFWSYEALDCTFIDLGDGAAAIWDEDTHRFKMTSSDAGEGELASWALTFAVGQVVEVCFVWDFLSDNTMAIVVDGVNVGSLAAYTLGTPDTYTVFNTPSAHSLYSLQIWPVDDATYDYVAMAVALHDWGRPEAELLVVTPPTDTKNTNGKYLLQNTPGSRAARLRLILDGTSQDYAQLKLGVRPLAAVATLAWECEAGTNGADTLDAADATASGGNVAQFTPTDAATATRVTVVLAADPNDVAAIRGKHRLYLQLKDNAGTANYNLIKWRLVVAGQAEDYSEEFAAAAVGTYSLVDLGTLEIQPGTWPAESLAATTDVHAGSYITLEIAVRNTASAGTLDLDAVYLAPAELEGTWLGTFDVSAWYELIDFTGERPCAIGVADPRSLEFAAWAAYTGDILELPAVAGDAGTLWARWLRSAAEQCYAADVCDVWVFVEPRWL